MPEANLFMSYLMRDGKALPIDLYKLIIKGDMDQNIVMKGGDRIFIAPPNEAKVYVLGEVFSPKAVNVPYGSISMTEVIVSKDRRGPVGTARLVFVHDEVKFADLPPAYNMGGGQYVSA